MDGNHQEQATKEYFDTITNYSHNKTIIIFDDIHWSSGIINAWKYIINSNKTSLTIDLFYWDSFSRSKIEQRKLYN